MELEFSPYPDYDHELPVDNLDLLDFTFPDCLNDSDRYSRSED
jgi:hypothetical protein